MIFIAQCLPCSINDHESCTELLLEHMESGEQLLNSPDDNGRYSTHTHNMPKCLRMTLMQLSLWFAFTAVGNFKVVHMLPLSSPQDCSSCSCLQ